MPIRASASRDVFMPSAAMAVMIRKDDICVTAAWTVGGTMPSELMAASARKPNRKIGGAGRAPLAGPPLRATHQAIPATAGSRKATRSSLVMMASASTLGPMV